MTTKPTRPRTGPKPPPEAEIEAVTDWFPPAYRPQHAGEYEIAPEMHENTVKKAIWNGAIWLDIDTGVPLINQKWLWRGAKKYAKRRKSRKN